MPRIMNRKAGAREAQAKRASALVRREFCEPSADRRPSGGIVSMAVKAEDPATRAMIDAFLAKREGVVS